MDANERLHIEWIGMAQPQGLVVTLAALRDAEAKIVWPIADRQADLRALAGEAEHITDLRALFRDILDWSDEHLLSGREIPPSLSIAADGEILSPTFAVRSADEADTFVLLIQETDVANLDAASEDKRWFATPHQRFERLLRETGVGVGLLTNGSDFRLAYAPRGESPGWITFRLTDMLTVEGRPLLGAFHMLLNESRLLLLGAGKRLGDLLRTSREYQSTVSIALGEQILAALNELLVGFQHADSLAGGALLHEYRRGAGLRDMYLGLVTVLMRMVFVLFAEERGLLPMESDLYASHYSLSRLHAQLQEARHRHGDIIDDQYGAWGRILMLFRLLHDGARAADGLFIPARGGSFFYPNAFPFLEGRPRGSARQVGEVLAPPRVSDGIVCRVLDRLLMLGGERLQYRTLEVEQIGSALEGLMGFDIEAAEGDSVCLMPQYVVVDLDALLRLPGADRVNDLRAKTGLDLKGKTATEVKEAESVEALHASLARRVSRRQPGILARGSLYLQPGERRTAWAVHTPRKLTQPIVQTTLHPVLEQLSSSARPEQILDLKVCDPAMGSGAFLVEVCRLLADELVAAWRRTDTLPELPADTDPVLHARRLVAERCIYGIDKDPLAVELARLSLWFITSSKELPLTFVDHSLRHGDSLIGLSAQQIYNLSIDPAKGHKGVQPTRNELLTLVRGAEELRRKLHAVNDPVDRAEVSHMWDDTEDTLAKVRLVGDAMVACHFGESSDKARQAALDSLATKIPSFVSSGAHAAELRGLVADLHDGKLKGSKQPVSPFHWEIEFPEVFHSEPGRRGGFDCVIGNPPFAGQKRVLASSGEAYVHWLMNAFVGAHGGSDLAAYFFRRAFDILRQDGTFGLVAPNTIALGDTRRTGLGWICANGGHLFEAHRRVTWPGSAAIIVSVIHAARGRPAVPCRLDGRIVPKITAFLFHGGSNDTPSRLLSNENRSFLGSTLLGVGFTFDDQNPHGTSISEMQQLLAKDARNAERILPYQSGEEINSSPTQQPRRYVIDFTDMTEAEAWRWPDLMAIIEAKVKPERQRLGDTGEARRKKDLWWTWGQYSRSLFEATRGLECVMVRARLSAHHAIAIVPSGRVMANSVVVFAFDSHSGFAVLQSRIHECWARLLGPFMKDALLYSPADCFETFPFPPTYETSPALETIGKTYHEFRAALMIANNEGLTKTYNRFHDPDERSPDIAKLRDLHAAMDRAVLDANGWTDIQPVHDFRPQLDESLRYTWAEETQDEVLARLLELNRLAADKEAPRREETKRARSGRKSAGTKRGRKDGSTSVLLTAQTDGNTLGRRPEMLTRIETQDVEPAELNVGFAPRLNLLAGDNGLGKTFVLDLAWWALTGTWAQNPVIPRLGENVHPTIWSELASKGLPRRVETQFDFAGQVWDAKDSTGSPLVVYARPDGAFNVWDAFRSRAAPTEPSRGLRSESNRFSLNPTQVWDELKMEDGTVLCNGLLRDWDIWQSRKPEIFDLLTRVLARLSPHPNEIIRPGLPRRVSRDAREAPTIELPYGNVPVTHASSGIRRVLALAYMLVWTWTEHTEAARLQNTAPLDELVLLIDEIDAHLHPTWQRVILPALFQVFPEIERSLRVQMLVSTHSPLVLASAEPLFDEERDVLLHFALRDAKIVVEQIPWAKQGDAVNWLVSEAFGLEQARSREAERAIEAAEAFMRGDPTPANLDTHEKIHTELLRVLAGHDAFWPRWLVKTGVVE